MGMFSSDEKEDIFRSNTESMLRQIVGELEVEELHLKHEIDKLKAEKRAIEEKLNEQNNLVDSLTNLLNRKLLDANGEELQLRDYLIRQRRIFNNKVKHGFNTTNIYQEARYILEETAELMRAIEKNNRENMLEELADIVIFSYGCAEVARLGDLDTKIFEKMQINEKRVYEKNGEGDFVKTAISRT